MIDGTMWDHTYNGSEMTHVQGIIEEIVKHDEQFAMMRIMSARAMLREEGISFPPLEHYGEAFGQLTQRYLSSKSSSNPEDVEGVKKAIDFILKAATTLGDRTKGVGDVSDGYHTYNELYHHRAVLFSVICNMHPELAWKSKQHDDPNEPMYDGMFIVGIETPAGQATYHYDVDPYWAMFDVEELERAPKWDGHTPDEAIRRIATLGGTKA